MPTILEASFYIVVFLYPIMYFPAMLVIQLIEDRSALPLSKSEVASMFSIIASKQEILTSDSLSLSEHKYQYIKLLVLSKINFIQKIFMMPPMDTSQVLKIAELNNITDKCYINLLCDEYKNFWHYQRISYYSYPSSDTDICKMRWSLFLYALLISIGHSMLLGILLNLSSNDQIGIFILVTPPLLLIFFKTSSIRNQRKANRALTRMLILIITKEAKID